MKDIVEFLKLPSRILAILLAAVTITSGGMLFLPNVVIKKLYLMEVKDKYGFIIGFLFLLSSSLLIVCLVIRIWDIFIKKISRLKEKKWRIKYLLNLDDLRTDLIIEFLKEPTHTLSLPFDNGVTTELNGYRLISLTSSTQIISYEGYEVKYFLQPWVRELIKGNKQLQKKFYVELDGDF